MCFGNINKGVHDYIVMDIQTTILLHLIFLLPAYAQTQLISPCPHLFKYDPQGTETDRWYGTLTLRTDAELNGVWLRLIFDKPSLQIGNWFGEAVTTDNQDYLLKKPGHKLYPNQPFQVRFFIRYDPKDTPPQLVSFRLNAKTVCPEDGATTTENSGVMGQLSTSNPLSNNIGNNAGDIDTSNSNSGTSSGTESSFNFPGDSRPSSSNNQATNTCGRVAMRPTPLIAHGQNTTKGQWPWHAALYHTQRAQLKYTCGGTLISENHILTAAHCVAKPRTKKPVDVTQLTVYLGKYSLKKFGPETQDVEVSDIFIHPQYNSSNFFNDIAVVKFKEEVEITDHVRTVCLWDGSTEIENVVNKLGTVVGWGFDEDRRISDFLLQAQMPVVSSVQCIYSNRDFFSQFTFEKNYCAGYRNGTTVCNGDSGGGMVFPKSGTTGHNTVWQIRGIVSVGVALQGEGVCDPTNYVVFTDVAKHLNWIRQIMNG